MSQNNYQPNRQINKATWLYPRKMITLNHLHWMTWTKCFWVVFFSPSWHSSTLTSAVPHFHSYNHCFSIAYWYETPRSPHTLKTTIMFPGQSLGTKPHARSCIEAPWTFPVFQEKARNILHLAQGQSFTVLSLVYFWHWHKLNCNLRCLHMGDFSKGSDKSY